MKDVSNSKSNSPYKVVDWRPLCSHVWATTVLCRNNFLSMFLFDCCVDGLVLGVPEGVCRECYGLSIKSVFCPAFLTTLLYPQDYFNLPIAHESQSMQYFLGYLDGIHLMFSTRRTASSEVRTLGLRMRQWC